MTCSRCSSSLTIVLTATRLCNSSSTLRHLRALHADRQSDTESSRFCCCCRSWMMRQMPPRSSRSNALSWARWCGLSRTASLSAVVSLTLCSTNAVSSNSPLCSCTDTTDLVQLSIGLSQFPQCIGQRRCSDAWLMGDDGNSDMAITVAIAIS